METAKRTYEILNSELHDELPALHDSRVLFMVTNMQTLFAAEEVFHTETSKVYSELEAIVDKLAKEVQRGTLPRKVLPKPQPLQGPNQIAANSLSSGPKSKQTNNIMMLFTPLFPPFFKGSFPYIEEKKTCLERQEAT